MVMTILKPINFSFYSLYSNSTLLHHKLHPKKFTMHTHEDKNQESQSRTTRHQARKTQDKTGSFQSKGSHSETVQNQSEPVDNGPGKPEFQALKMASWQNSIQRKQIDTGASDQPAERNARAFAWATDSYLAPGMAKHLPQEAGNVVQRKQEHANLLKKEREMSGLMLAQS